MTKPYQINSFNTLELVEEFGSPIYVYDADKIVSQINKMKEAFSEVPTRLKYACKALTNINIIKLMKQNGVGIDTVSIEEAKIALKAGYSPKEIQYTPSGVSFEEITEAVDLGIRINLDSISVLEKFGEKYGDQYPIAIRLNPDIMAGGNLKISTGHSDSKFGIPYEYLPQAVEVIKKYGIKIVGLHQHNGSDFKDSSIIVEAMEKSIKAALEYFPNLEFIDMGSGFKVAYSPEDHVTEIDKLALSVCKRFKEFINEYGKEIELWFEPGKFLVSEAGHLLVKVNTIKPTPNRTFIQVNSGLNHLIRPMMYDAYHQIINCNNVNGNMQKYDVVGYICETDTLAKDRLMAETKEGDLLSIENAGAYGYSMASNYNSRLRPAEVLLINGEAKLIRKADTLEDILHNQIDIL